MRLAAAVLLLVAAGASAAPKRKAAPKTESARPYGRVVKSSSKISPGSDGPVFREGRVTILLSETEVEEEFKAGPKTKITLDGKAAKFGKAAVVGAIVLRADADPKTKELRALDLKSGPRPAEAEAPAEAATYAAGPVEGEVANIDVIKGLLSVRVGRQTMRDLLVDDGTRIAGRAASRSTSRPSRSATASARSRRTDVRRPRSSSASRAERCAPRSACGRWSPSTRAR
ncbi:MAG: hypothetical protein M0D55_12510 [Elusimicrobiota bacterium]|nr:MAG: hypothetical protein M0D55_12510 [Elusimicrobiota bacterium]